MKKKIAKNSEFKKKLSKIQDLKKVSKVHDLTVCVAKPGSLWVLDSQLKTEIHSFSESPPSDVSKYHRGPFGQRPQGP